MHPLDEAIVFMNSQDAPHVSEAARKFQVDRSTLSKKFKRQSGSRAQAAEKKQLLSIKQEKILIKDINRLCERGFPPTPCMVASIAGRIAQRQPSKNWTSRLVKRWTEKLDSRYLNTVNIARHGAESEDSFRTYFDALRDKIEQYGIQPENMYNMDEKGFLIGHLTKSKRVFTKARSNSQKLIGTSQDGNRQWITVVATICADGSSLSPGLIYQGQTNSIQDTWLDRFDDEEHSAFFTSSPNRWTSTELGFDWLVNLFDRETRDKAKRDWRLLYVDGHGSHLTLQFLDWCQTNKKLVAVYPPHATHRWRPLDVSLFAPLATYYSKGLDTHMRLSEGLTAVSKRDFFSLFWPAWQESFTEANISSGWSKTGLWRFDPSVVMSIFAKAPSPLAGPVEEPHTPHKRCSDSDGSNLTPRDWRRVQGIINKTVRKVSNVEQRKSLEYLGDKVISQSAEITLLKEGNKRLAAALTNEQKRRKRGRKLMEEFRARDEGNATFFSPGKVRQLKDLQQARENEKEQQQLDKVARAQGKEREKAVKAQQLADRRLERQKKAEQKKEALAARLAAKATAKAAREAANQLNQNIQASSKRTEGRKKPLKEAQEPHDDPDVIVVKSRPRVPKPAVSSTGRVIKPSKRLQN